MSEPNAKTVAQSRTEQVHIIMPLHLNQSFRVFGGQLMQWIDVVAGVVARRHCGCEVTTAAVDHLVFEAPACLNDIIVLGARAWKYAWRPLWSRSTTTIAACSSIARS